MPRLSPLPPEAWSAEQAELIRPMLKNDVVGEVANNLFSTLLRHPKLFKRWSVFANHILFKSTLPAEARELIILRIAWLCQAEYEWGQHVLIARDYGITDEVIRRVKRGPEDKDWSARESLLLRAVDEVHANCEINADTWSELHQALGDEQILDLIFTVGNYRLLATVMRSTGVELDEGVPDLKSP